MGQFIAPKATTTQRLTIIPDQGELLFDTTVNKLYGGDGTTTGGFLIGNGDVSGPSSAVNNRVVFFDGPTGKLIKDSGLTLSGTNTGDQTITLTGDVTGSGTGSFAASISAGSVTLAKMANLAANSIIGNNTGSAATPIALSGTNVTAMLDAFSSTLKGLAPASGGGTTNFLRADGTWAAPPNSGGTVTSVSALTLGTSGTDLSSSVANGTTTPVITLNVPDASATNRGALTSTDWSTFNGKESVLTFSTGLSRVGNTITNTITQYTDADARLAISDSVTGLDYNSTTGVWSTTSGYGIPTTASQTNWDTAYTNRITSLTTTGSSGSATLVSNTLNIPTYTLAGLGGFANPMTTAGDIIYGGTSGVATRLAGSGTNGWVLTYDTATNAPKWAASSGGGGMAIGGSITSATAGSILFADTSGVLAQDNTNFFWNNSNKRLGIGTASPTTTLDVRGAFNFLNTGALTSTLQDIGTYTINSSGTTAVGFGMRLLLQGRVNTSDSQPFGYISPYIRYYSALPSSWGTGMNIAIYNNGSYINVINITGNSGGEVTITNGLTVGGQSYISANSLSHSTQVIGGFNNGQNSAITYRTTNAGSLLTSQGVFGLATVTAGSISIRPHDTNGVVFTAGNGASHIARAAIQIVSLTNTAGSESGDLALYTQSGGTAISEKMRIFAAGNVGIGTGSTNAGYKFDVNGTARFQNDVTISDTRNFIFSATTGTKIGTATGQKLAFWNKTPIAQPTTASLSSTFTANTGTAVNDASTFGGYTLKQIAQALIDIGILA